MNSKEHCDLIIIGSGLAGTSAAIEAATLGGPQLKIIIFEMESTYGGNSTKSSSGMNAAETNIQQIESVQDNYDLFEKDTENSGKGLSSQILVKKLVTESTQAWEFITNFGVDLSCLAMLGGHSVPRSHRPKNSPLGITIMNKLHGFIKQSLPQIQLNLNSEIISLIKVETRIVGVNLKDRQVFANSVIIATGGFSNDRTENSLLKEFAPHLLNIPTTNGTYSQGQGMKMARQIGAELIQMEQIQIHPTGFIDPSAPFAKTKFLGPELLRGSGGILIDKQGCRFCNELGYRNYISQKIFEVSPITENSPQSSVLIMLNEEAAANFGPTMHFYITKGLIQKFENGHQVAKYFNLPSESLAQTIVEYNQYAENVLPDPFEKKIFPVKFDFSQVLYVASVTPSLHYSMGGIKINEKCEVLDMDGNRIKGLFAAGEVTGGIHGGNRLGGNSILDCVVFGRTAGQNAVVELQLQIKQKLN